MSVLRNSRSIRYSYNLYQHSPGAVKAASVVVYGLKCYLSLAGQCDGKPQLVYFASYPSEHRVLNHVQKNLQAVAHGKITISLRNCFRFAALNEILEFVPAIARLYRFARRLVRKHHFMPACRIFSTVTYYMRFNRLLDEDAKAVFIACWNQQQFISSQRQLRRTKFKKTATNRDPAKFVKSETLELHRKCGRVVALED